MLASLHGAPFPGSHLGGQSRGQHIPLVALGGARGPGPCACAASGAGERGWLLLRQSRRHRRRQRVQLADAGGCSQADVSGIETERTLGTRQVTMRAAVAAEA